MAIITSEVFLIVLTVCSARPPYESNDILDVLRENGVHIPEMDQIDAYAASTTTKRPTYPPTPTTLSPNTTTTYLPYTTTPTTTTTFAPNTTSTYPPTTPTTTPYITTTTPTTTTTAPPTTTPPTPPPTTTTTPKPTPHLKLIKKKVITIEDFEAESEL